MIAYISCHFSYILRILLFIYSSICIAAQIRDLARSRRRFREILVLLSFHRSFIGPAVHARYYRGCQRTHRRFLPMYHVKRVTMCAEITPLESYWRSLRLLGHSHVTSVPASPLPLRKCSLFEFLPLHPCLQPMVHLFRTTVALPLLRSCEHLLYFALVFNVLAHVAMHGDEWG